MKSHKILLIVGALVLALSSCSGGGPETTAGNSSGYTVEVEELDANAVPDGYPLIAADDFVAAFEGLKDANLNQPELSYQDIADLFGVDGAYYVNNNYDAGGVIFQYYGWYAENDVSVLVTFKANGDDLEYYAYTGNGIS